MAETLEIRLIEAGDKLTGLSVGDAKFTVLKTFVQKHAKAYEDKGLARTYAAFLKPDDGGDTKFVGYITLVCGQVVIGDGDECLLADDAVQYPYKHYPAVKVARLLVDSRQRKKRIGENLVSLALGTVKENVCPRVGCRFMVVDSKKDAVNFYLKCGFTLLDTAENKNRDEPIMFMDLHKIEPE